MAVMSGILTVLCACCLCPAPPSQPHGAETFTVHVNIEFDQSIKSKVVESVLKAEAAELWKAYDVGLLWTSGGCDAAVDLDVVVAGGEGSEAAGGRPLALGKTTINQSGVVQGPIRIEFDTLDSLIKHRSDAVTLLHDLELGRALGRVLAHELGHALLGYPAYHDRLGLMRVQLSLRDLTEPGRDGIHLTDASALRLRDRLARLADAHKHRVAATSS
jgi:hypothetical protein